MIVLAIPLTGRSTRPSTWCAWLAWLVAAVLAYILVHGFYYTSASNSLSSSSPARQADENEQSGDNVSSAREEARNKARSFVLLLATLAATITYAAGLNPAAPGGVWQDNEDGHMAGDPILLLTTNARRYKVFFYCNSIAFVASLVAIIMVQKVLLVKQHVLEAAMILDLFGLIDAYAAGSCRNVNTSIYVMALAGVVLVYVVIHVVFFTLDEQDDDQDRLLEKRRKPDWPTEIGFTQEGIVTLIKSCPVCALLLNGASVLYDEGMKCLSSSPLLEYLAINLCFLYNQRKFETAKL